MAFSQSIGRGDPSVLDLHYSSIEAKSDPGLWGIKARHRFFAKKAEAPPRIHRPGPVDHPHAGRFYDDATPALFQTRIGRMKVSVVIQGLLVEIGWNRDERSIFLRDINHRLMLSQKVVTLSPSLPII